MTLPCCTTDGEVFQPYRLEGQDAERWVSAAGPGLKRIAFIVPQANGPEAIVRIEQGLAGLDGVKDARVNLTGRRVTVVYAEDALAPQALIVACGFQVAVCGVHQLGLQRPGR